jgi:hypothetical protein
MQPGALFRDRSVATCDLAQAKSLGTMLKFVVGNSRVPEQVDLAAICANSALR